MKKWFIILIVTFAGSVLQIAPSPTAFSQSEDDARKLYQQGMDAHNYGRYQESLAYHEQSLKINRSLNNQEGIAANLNNIGAAYDSLGRYEDALKYHEESLKIRKELNIPQDIATSLNNIGAAYDSLGRYEDALKYHEESLKIRKGLNDPQGIAISLNNIGAVYNSLGRYEDALKYYEESLKIRKELNIPQGIAISLNNIGAVYNSLGRYEDALKYYEESLKIYRVLNIPQDIATSLNNIGAVYDSLGQYEDALKYHEESLKIRKELSIPQAIATSLNKIGMVYTSLGRYDDALKYYEESFKILRELNIPQEIASCLNNIGVVYDSLGRYEYALKYHEKSLKIRKELNIPQGIAISLNNIGAVYNSLGRYEDALKYHEESLKIYRELNVPQDVASCLNYIGMVYDSLGRYEDALKYYEESLKIYRVLNIPQDIASCLNNIGTVYNSLGRYEDALKYHEESLKIRKELSIPQDIAASLNNIGMVYISLKDYIKAEKVFKEAEEKELSIGLKRFINSGMVDLYLATKRYGDALRMLEKKMPSLSSVPDYQIQYFTQRGSAFKGNKRLKESSGDFLKAAITIEEIRAGIKGEKAGFLGVTERIEAYQGLFSSLSERGINGEKTDKDFNNYGKDLASAAFYFSEATKARILLEAMAESARKSRRVGIPEGLREKEQSLLNQISAIDSQWEDVYKKGEDALKAFKERRNGLTAELNTLINELRQKYPEYAALYYPKPIPPEELPLRDNEVLLEYAMTDDACYLFVVRKGGVKSLYKIPFGKETLESKVQEFVDAIKDPIHKKFPIMAAKELHDILLTQALKDIKTGDKVIIVPDGILGALPFESLVVKEGNSINDSLYAGDVYTLSYYQSASVLSMLRHLKQEKAKRALFALGNPVYSAKDERYIAYKERKPLPVKLAQQGDHAAFRAMVVESKWGKTTKDDKNADELAFKPLPETEDEVKAVAELFDVQPQPPDVLLGINASETNLRKSPLREYRYLHFATHADLPGKVQGIKEPFLLLGQVENKGKDDGFLTMSEVLDLELNAEMVVLSACLTGRGKVMAGEGVMNFARAFQHAGARSVLVSLWDVASKEAVEYMDIFYRHVKDGKNRTDAMKQARKEIKSRYPHPFYWSVFVLYGEG